MPSQTLDAAIKALVALLKTVTGLSVNCVYEGPRESFQLPGDQTVAVVVTEGPEDADDSMTNTTFYACTVCIRVYWKQPAEESDLTNMRALMDLIRDKVGNNPQLSNTCALCKWLEKDNPIYWPRSGAVKTVDVFVSILYKRERS